MNKRINTTGKLRAQSGFTLIELMIVVAIMGVLAAIAIPRYQGYIKTAKYVALKVTINELIAAQDRYYQSNEVFFPKPERRKITLKPNVATKWEPLGMFFPAGNKYKITMKSAVNRRRNQHTLTMTIETNDDLNENGKLDRIIYTKRIKAGKLMYARLVWKK